VRIVPLGTLKIIIAIIIELENAANWLFILLLVKAHIKEFLCGNA
jgi:hypothetical protein